jgi:hypothetical protein
MKEAARAAFERLKAAQTAANNYCRKFEGKLGPAKFDVVVSLSLEWDETCVRMDVKGEMLNNQRTLILPSSLFDEIVSWWVEESSE